MSIWKALGAVGAALVCVIAGIAYYFWTPSGERFDPDGARTAASEYQTRIIRDSYGVPHIYGPRDRDVVFGLAYAHAEDDWRRIEEVLRSNRGRLAEIKGEEASNSDFLIWALGNIEAVEQGYEVAVTPEARTIADAYAAGLNAWCADNLASGCTRTLPARGQDIIAGYANRPPFFYGLDGEINSLLNGEGSIEMSARQAYLGVPADVQLGSNALAVAPSRSADGHTRLAVNSHQPYEGTVSWYEVRLKSGEGIDVLGGVFPGSPLILHGAGPDLGWAATVNRPDVFDVFRLETDDPLKPRRYRMDGEWKDLAVKPIRYRVKMWGPFSRPVVREGLTSEHGPVFVTPRGVFAVSYMGRGELRYLDQYLAMNKARTVEDWRAAQIRINAIPSNNYVVADRHGSIAYVYNARMPVREEGWDRRKVLPGDVSSVLWRGVEPVEKLPAVINPVSGYVVNANHTPFQASGPDDNPSPEAFPASFGVDVVMTNRGMRAQELYGQDESITGEEFIAYKMDDRYSETSNLRRMVAEVIEEGAGGDQRLAEALDLLKRWDGSAKMDSRTAALAILSGQRAMGGQINQPASAEAKIAAVRETADLLRAAYGRIDPMWSEVSRIVRGASSWATDGGPDTLRAVYARGDLLKDRRLAGAAGDTFVMIADWGPDGSYQLSTIHQFGSATQDKASPHFADQAPLFAAKVFKSPPMTLEGVLAEAEREYFPGAGAGAWVDAMKTVNLSPVQGGVTAADR
ncbi:MAG: penicillin acylase family protein [Alphaproteobacteria bacterium]|nr:penicillin acylase family protein [Alphaproteobacteria bacterium]